MTVTAAQDGKARILKYTLSGDLQKADYDGIIFTNTAKETSGTWNAATLSGSGTGIT
jgi:hypothetical protein